MKLSPRTISILQNFQTISPSILFTPGNRIRTVTAKTNSIMAEALVEDEFPKEFGIYELSKFLGILSLDKNSELDFHDKYVMIKQKHGSTKYFYCYPEMVADEDALEKIRAPKPFQAPDVVTVKFELSAEVLQSLIKSMAILQFSEIAVCGSEGKLTIDALDVTAEKRGRDHPNRYSAVIGETEKTFMATIEAEKLKMLQLNYTATVSHKYGCLHLKGKFDDAVSLSYFIVLSGTKSDFRNV